MLSSARLRAALGLGVVLSVGVTGTFAYWTDNVSVAGTTFSSGSINLKVDNSDNVTGYTSLALSNMVPGNSKAAVLTVANTGNVPLKYKLSSTATNADGKNLAAALTVKVTADTATGGSGAAITCPGAAISASSALNAPLFSTGRQVAGAGSQQVCVQVTLPSSVTDNALQGATTNVVLAFDGTSDLS